MFRAALFLAFSIFAVSSDAADLKVTAYVFTQNDLTANLTGGMISPEIPLPNSYGNVTLTPTFQVWVMLGMGIYVMYAGHQGTLTSAVIQGRGCPANSMVNAKADYFEIQDGMLVLVKVPCNTTWE